MKKTALLLCLLCCAQLSHAQRYVIFLHSMFLELKPLGEKHPEYGRVEYNEILDAYRKRGMTVISEIRAKDTDAKKYAKKVVKQIDSLLKHGAQAPNITVVGTSKGGLIAMQVSSLLHNSEVNYVFVGCCFDSQLKEDPKLQVCGNILSIYEKSDNTQSCASIKNASKCNIPHYKEVQLNTGLKHGFLYKALPGWIDPSIQWAANIYR